MAQVPFTPLIIDGEERPSSNGDVFEIRKPHSDTLVGTAASATDSDCLAAINAASKAFKTWEKSRPVDRRNIFLKAADLFASEHWCKVLMQTSQDEIGFAPHWSTFDGTNAGGYLRAQAGLVDRLRGEYYPSASLPGAMVYAQYRAKGVILAIAPWNAPVMLTVRAIAVPIFCGNTVVLKGSELTPRSHYLVTKIFEEAGLPSGVLNCISISPGSVPSRISEIIAHPKVRHINFTGSDRVGKVIAMEAAKYLKPCVLELGGKAPTIVLQDADIKEASKAIVFGAMANSGQVCMATERVIVHKDIASAITSNIREVVSGLKAGDTSIDANAKLGPLFSERLAQRIVDLVRQSQEDGAEILLGDLTRDKAVVQPHLVVGVKPGMALWDEESFGPVIGFTTFETVDEAVELANTSTYSLTSSVWTKDVAKAQEIASQLHYGTVNINGVTIHTEPIDGLVGLGGASGYGKFDIGHFTDKRTTIVHPGGRQYPII